MDLGRLLNRRLQYFKVWEGKTMREVPISVRLGMSNCRADASECVRKRDMG